MEALWNMGIKTLMVEGGATVIESFINSAHVDSLVIKYRLRLLVLRELDIIVMVNR